MSERRSNRGERGPRGGKTAKVSARFRDVEGLRDFFDRLGMPESLVRQLGGWLEEISAGGEMERMEPELTWEGREARLTIDALVDGDGEVDVEFGGPATLIEALQADLDEVFRPKKGRRP